MGEEAPPFMNYRRWLFTQPTVARYPSFFQPFTSGIGVNNRDNRPGKLKTALVNFFMFLHCWNITNST